MFKLDFGKISWYSKRQRTISLSIIEVEYRVETMIGQESTWLVQLTNDSYHLVDYAAPLYCDNQSVICLAKNLVFHAITKHVDMYYYFIR